MPVDRRSRHFGVLSFTGTGHLNPLITLSQELRNRGHKVTFFERAKIRDRVLGAGLDFVSIAALPRAKQNPPGSDSHGIRHEIAMLRFNLLRITREIEHYLAETSAALAGAGVDALLINEIALTGPTVAQLLGLPYFLISTSVPHHFGWASSSWFTGYRYSPTALSWLQGWFFELSALHMRGPVRRTLNRFRRTAGLGPMRKIAGEYPCLAHITQLPECLDLPRRPPTGNFYYTGPWLSNDARMKVDFPWERLDGRPIAYVTMGTTRNSQSAILRMIADACRDLDAQLVISLGNRFDPDQFTDLPGRPIVTRFAPQLELLKRAAIAITHGGPNTAFEALMEGRPIVAIPLAYDQPAIAKRLKRLGVAEVLPVMRLSTDRIRRAVTKVLGDPHYREAAERVQSEMRATRGAKRAADIIAVELSGYAAQRQFAVLARRSFDKQEQVASGVVNASYLQR
jgi:UDP:flavonoid glycosyltransferase YjiC (YdhE family)